MQDLTDIKIFFASILQPIVYEAIRDQMASSNSTILPVSELDELLTPDETAKVLKVSKVTVWDWNKRGILQSRRIGNQVRYLRSEVMAAARPIKSNR